jgi:hypothetical protein
MYVIVLKTLVRQGRLTTFSLSLILVMAFALQLFRYTMQQHTFYSVQIEKVMTCSPDIVQS